MWRIYADSLGKTSQFLSGPVYSRGSFSKTEQNPGWTGDRNPMLLFFFCSSTAVGGQSHATGSSGRAGIFLLFLVMLLRLILMVVVVVVVIKSLVSNHILQHGTRSCLEFKTEMSKLAAMVLESSSYYVRIFNWAR